MKKSLVLLFALSLIFGLSGISGAADKAPFPVPPGVEYSNHEQPTFHGREAPKNRELP